MLFMLLILLLVCLLVILCVICHLLLLQRLNSILWIISWLILLVRSCPLFLKVLMKILLLLLSVGMTNLLICIVHVFQTICLNKFVFVIWLLKMPSDYPLKNLQSRFLRQVYQPFSVLTNAELADMLWNYLCMLDKKYK